MGDAVVDRNLDLSEAELEESFPLPRKMDHRRRLYYFFLYRDWMKKYCRHFCVCFTIGVSCLVIGVPLPPIPGEFFYRKAQVLFPRGYKIKPLLDESFLRILYSDAQGLVPWEKSETSPSQIPKAEPVNLSSLARPCRTQKLRTLKERF